MLKCTKCKEIKDESEFHPHKNTKSKYATACKVCSNLANKAYRKKVGPKIQRDYLRERRRLHKRKIIEYFGHSCLDCGIVDEPCVYDIHHLDPSIKEIGIAQYLDRKWDKILPLLDGCVLLCSNCHRKRHFSYEEVVAGNNLADMLEI